MKDKIIEEMAKHLHSTHAVSAMCVWKDCNHCKHADLKRFEEYTCIDLDLAESLYNAGYRKIPENAVVLKREEYEKLKLFEERVRSGVCFTQKEWFDYCQKDSNERTSLLIKAKKDTRKETAEKFAEKLKVEFDEILLSDTPLSKIDEICKEITEKGVQNGD